MANLLPNPKQQYFAADGSFLVGGKIYTYAAGTSTPQPTWQDADATIYNTNPVILDSQGQATIYWVGVYKVLIKDANDVLIYSQDNVSDGLTTLADTLFAQQINAVNESKIQAEAEIQAVANSMGYLPPVAYAAGIAMTTSVQTVEYLSNTYAPVISALPFTTSGTFETAKFRLIQGVSQADLSAATGSYLVGYQPAGTASVATRVQEKLRESVSVKDFGAAGDGITNDSPAIQAAVDYLKSVGIGGTLYFPQGIYLIDTTITVPDVINNLSGLTLVGCGWGTEIKAGAATSSLFLITGRNVTFSNMYFTNTSTLTNTAIVTGGVYTDSYPGLTVDSCKFIGFSNGLGLTYTNHTITNNFFLNNTCHISFADDGRNSYVFGNYMLGGSTGIRFDIVGANAEGVRIINNTIMITGSLGVGIDIFSALEMTIMGNIIDQTGPNGIGIYIHPTGAKFADRIKITSNWVAGGQYGYSLWTSGTTSNIECTNNSFVSNNGLTTTAGISLSATNTYQLIGNNFLITGGNDLNTAGATNGTIFGNSSSNASSNILDNSTPNNLTTTKDVTAANVYTFKVGVYGLTGPTITGGGALPTTVEPVGSLYLRSDAGVGFRLYVSQGAGAWLAVAGV